MPAGPAVDDVIAWLDFRAWGAAIAFSPSRQRESEATHGFSLIRDAESASVETYACSCSSNALPRWTSYYSHCTMHCVHFAHFRAVQMWTSSHIHLIFDFCILDVAISHAGVRREAGHVHRTAYTPDSLENAPRGVP